MIISRFILNLQEVNEEINGLGTATQTAQSGIQFRYIGSLGEQVMFADKSHELHELATGTDESDRRT